LALQRAERVVFALSTPMFLMQSVFSWPITILNRIGIGVLRLVGVEPPKEGTRLHTPEELELIISDSVVGGLLEAENQKLLHNIFDFANLHVGQIVTPRPLIDAVSVDISKADLLEKMFTSIHSRFPVYENDLDHILGIVHLKDLVHLHLEDTPYDLRALLHEAPFVPEGLAAEALLSILKRRRVHMAIVIDEYGGTAGIVTLEDLLEEVVGEVRDEFDTAEHDHITVVEPGHLIVLGSTRLDELAGFIDISDDERTKGVDTIGGLLVSMMPLPPQQGAEVSINEVNFRTESVKGLTIQEVSIRFNPETNPLDSTHS
jgi:CBS domain containing-hemolysin-like protein